MGGVKTGTLYTPSPFKRHPAKNCSPWKKKTYVLVSLEVCRKKKPSHRVESCVIMRHLSDDLFFSSFSSSSHLRHLWPQVIVKKNNQLGRCGGGVRPAGTCGRLKTINKTALGYPKTSKNPSSGWLALCFSCFFWCH